MYCFQLKCNFVRQYPVVQRFFWPIANAKTQHKYDLRFGELEHMNRAAATYLVEIGQLLWIRIYISEQCLSYKTSNVLKSMNQLLKVNVWFQSVLYSTKFDIYLCLNGFNTTKQPVP